MPCRGVRVAVGMYASAGMRTHAFSHVWERCTAVCSIASEQSRHHSKQHIHVSMPPARAQERKWRKAHTCQNTTHGAASSCNTRYLVSIIPVIPGIWCPLSIISYLLFCWYTMRLRNIWWLPTSHSPHIKRDMQTRYSKDKCTLHRSAWWCLATGHKAQSMSDNIR